MLQYKTKYFSFDKGATAALLTKSEADGEVPSTYEIKARFTDETPDSHGDIITREGTTKALPDYRAWRNIRYMHQPKAVGLAKHIGEADGAELEWNEVIIKLVDKDTIHQVQEGVLKGLSVGILFNPFDSKAVEITEEGGWKINEYLLAEISVVDHPAHPNASVIEAALSKVEGEIRHITQEVKDAIRQASTEEELIPLFKSLVIDKKENDMAKDILEKEGRDWDKETASPDVEELVEEEVIEEKEEEEIIEEIAEEEIAEEAEEEAEVLEEEIVPEPEPEAEVLEAEVAEELEIEEPEEEEVAPELEQSIDGEEEDEEEIEEEEELEQLQESNETEDISIEVNEGTKLSVEERLLRMEAMLEKLLSVSTEDSEATEAEAEVETPVVQTEEELELADSELSTPSNRKPNMELGSDISDDNEDMDKKVTFRKKHTDSQTRIRQTLEQLIS